MLTASIVLLMIVALTRPVGSGANEDDSCPVGFVSSNETCVCADHLKEEIKCEQQSQSSFIYLGACVTYDNSSRATSIGLCPYTSYADIINHFYRKLPHNAFELNNFTCGTLNREGLLCAKCKEGFGPAVYSVALQCERCQRRDAWLLFIFWQLFPTTVLFLVVVVFRLRLTSAPVGAFVLFCQINEYIALHTNLLSAVTHDTSREFNFLAYIALAIYGIFNLDFLIHTFPSFCVSTEIETVHLFIFDYIAAFYPLFLVVSSYICIQLHDYGFRPIIMLWKPFHKCCTTFRRIWNIKLSIINAFAAFLLLSYSKIILVSFRLLYGTYIYNTQGEIIGSSVFFYDPTWAYFGKEHLPFAITAIFIIFVFVGLPPLLLIVYPTRIFRKCFGCCGLRRWHALRAFMETFQGCYKDGTGGTRDYRSLSGLYLLIRIIFILQFSTSIIVEQYAGLAWLYGGILLFALSVFFSVVRPYKRNYMNTVESLLLALWAVGSLLALNYLHLSKPEDAKILAALVTLVGCTPLIIVAGYVVYKMLKKMGVVRCIGFRRIGLRATHTLTELEEITEMAGDQENIPDRILNPESYTPLLNSSNSADDDTD